MADQTASTSGSTSEALPVVIMDEHALLLLSMSNGVFPGSGAELPVTSQPRKRAVYRCKVCGQPKKGCPHTVRRSPARLGSEPAPAAPLGDLATPFEDLTAGDAPRLEPPPPLPPPPLPPKRAVYRCKVCGQPKKGCPHTMRRSSARLGSEPAPAAPLGDLATPFEDLTAGDAPRLEPPPPLPPPPLPPATELRGTGGGPRGSEDVAPVGHPLGTRPEKRRRQTAAESEGSQLLLLPPLLPPAREAQAGGASEEPSALVDATQGGEDPASEDDVPLLSLHRRAKKVKRLTIEDGSCRQCSQPTLRYPHSPGCGRARPGSSNSQLPFIFNTAGKRVTLALADGSCRACANPRLKVPHNCGKGRERVREGPRTVLASSLQCVGCMPGRKARHTCGKSRADRKERAARVCKRCVAPGCKKKHTCGLGHDRAAQAAIRRALINHVSAGGCIQCDLKAYGNAGVGLTGQQRALKPNKAFHSDVCPKRKGGGRSAACSACVEMSLTGYKTGVLVKISRRGGHTCGITEGLKEAREAGRAERRLAASRVVEGVVELEASSGVMVEGVEAPGVGAMVVVRDADDDDEDGWMAQGEEYARPMEEEEGEWAARTQRQPGSESETEVETEGRGPPHRLQAGAGARAEPSEPSAAARVTRVDTLLIASMQHQAMHTLSDSVFAMGRALLAARRNPASAAAVRTWRTL